MCLKNAPIERLLPQCISRKPEGQVEKIRFLSNELIANTCTYLINFSLVNWDYFWCFGDFYVLSSAKKIRRRNFKDPPSPNIVQYRNLETPYPPKKVRRLLWTAPNTLVCIVR